MQIPSCRRACGSLSIGSAIREPTAVQPTAAVGLRSMSFCFRNRENEVRQAVAVPAAQAGGPL